MNILEKENHSFANGCLSNSISRNRLLLSTIWQIGIDEEENFLCLYDQMGFLMTVEQMEELINGLREFIRKNGREIIQQHNKQLFDEYDNRNSIPSPQPVKKPQKGFIYFIRDDKGRVKIGKTKRMKERMGEYTKLPFEPELLYVLESNDYHAAETLIHEYYQEKRIRGEWFALTEKDIAFIKSGKLEAMIDE